MNNRFLKNSDYKGVITEKHLNQLVRDDDECIWEAEAAAETPMLEYLSENYEIEKVLMDGKNIRDYNRQITYPSGAYFYKDDKICETLRTVNGYKAPSNKLYWGEYFELYENVPSYSQLNNYQPGDIVSFAGTLYICLEYNGIDFNDIRVPGLIGWETITAYPWEGNWEYNEWDVVNWEGKFYALVDANDVDLTKNPDISDNWGLIGDYDPEYNEYEFSGTEYVVYEGEVYVPVMEVNSDEVKQGFNIRPKDPRNPNVKKHMIRIAVYELHKLISPNNMSTVRITDYEESMRWLRDASKLRINPQIPRKLDDENKPVTDWQVATFQKDYDPYKNPWQV